jgi:hypothetical protein
VTGYLTGKWTRKSSQNLASVRTAVVGHQRRSQRWLDLDIGAYGYEQWREGGGIGMLDLDGFEDEPRWC